jgi:hypothetical protein
LHATERALQPISISEKDFRINIKDDNRFWMTMELTIDVNGKHLPLLPIPKSALSLLPSVTNDSLETLNRNGRFSAAIEDGSIITMPFERARHSRAQAGLQPLSMTKKAIWVRHSAKRI